MGAGTELGAAQAGPTERHHEGWGDRRGVGRPGPDVTRGPRLRQSRSGMRKAEPLRDQGRPLGGRD